MSESKIMFFKLITGEEVIAKAARIEGHAGYELTKPVIGQVMPTPEGKMSLSFAPWMPFSSAHKDGMKLSPDAILYAGSPAPEIENAYNQAFGNGLIKPASKQLIIS